MKRRFREIALADDSISPAEVVWLRDHGVEIDEKGRPIVSLPSPDGGEPYEGETEILSIRDLMRRDIDLKKQHSRPSRRRAGKPATKADGEPSDQGRRGRPPIGDERRIQVDTTIAKETARAIRERNMTLASILDACASELPNG
jgi:hypothetical protein